jgi:hypothetical protein
MGRVRAVGFRATADTLADIIRGYLKPLIWMDFFAREIT